MTVGAEMGLTDAEIVRVELTRVALPLTSAFEASHGTEALRQVVIVQLVAADGTIGLGEVDALSHPTYTHEYAAGSFVLLRDEVVPALLRGDSAASDALTRWHPMTRAALATARLDGGLRRVGRSLAEALGVPDRADGRHLARTAVLGRAGSIEQLLSWVDTAKRDGAALVKLKIAGPHDIDAAMEVCRAFPDLDLAADANGALQGFEPTELRRAGLDRLGLRYLEQPYAPDALVQLAELRRAVDTPVCLDESIGSLGAARVAHTLGALDLVNVKPARLGGPAEAAAVLHWAAQEGIGAFCGGMLELGVGRAAAAAVAALAALVGDGVPGGAGLPTDLGPSAAYVVEDLTDPVLTDAAGRLVVPSGPGIGVTLHRDRLERATVEHATLIRSR